MNKKLVLALGLGIGLVGSGTAQAQEAADGEKFFKRACGACHAVEEGKNRVGPHLAGVVGRQAASVEGYAYSPAMKESGLEWNEENLSKYLANPKEVIPGTKMTYAGVKKEEDLANLIAYLKTL